MSRLFLVDFDGTITLEDTCIAMVRAFARGDWARLNRLWEQKELDTVEVARQTLAMFQASRDDLDQLLAQMSVDPDFVPFYDTVLARGDELLILSDGYDYSIRSILQRIGRPTIPFYANELRVDAAGFTMDCGRPSLDCQLCGTCKKEICLELHREGWETVYIGDGASDECVCATADLVFAKGSLIRYCERQGIAYRPFAGFADIQAWYRTEI